MNRMRFALLAVITWACACRDPHDLTQTVISVDADPEVRAVVSHVKVLSRSLLDDALDEASSAEHPHWPMRVVLAPLRGDAARRFELLFSALGEGGQLFAFRLESGFVLDNARYARIHIRANCISTDSASCVTAECNSRKLAPSLLGHSSATAYALEDVACRPKSESQPAADGGGEPMSMDPSTSVTARGMTQAQSSGAAGMASDSGAPARAGSAADAGAGPSCPGGPNCPVVEQCRGDAACGHGICEEAPGGGHRCKCDDFYRWNDVTCANIDECTDGTSGCADRCVDLEGGFRCECTGDSWLKADGKTCARISMPIRLPRAPDSTLRCQPQIAFDAGGNALAVWIRANAQGAALWSARFVNGKGWNDASQVPFVAAASIDTPVLALAATGAGLALWIQSGQPHLELHGASFDGQSFAAPVLAGSGPGGDIQYPTLALAPNGDALAMWTYFNDSETDVEVWADRWLASRGAFTGTRTPLVTNTNHYGISGQIAVDAQNQGMLVWTEAELPNTGSTPMTPWYADVDLTLPWPALGVSGPMDTQPGRFPGVALTATGSGFTAWHQEMGSDQAVVLMRRFAAQHTTIQDATRLSASYDRSSYMVPPRIVVDAAGRPIAIWTEARGGARSISGAVTDMSGEIWSPHVRVSSLDSAVLNTNDAGLRPPVDPAFDIAVDSKGAGLVLWSDFPTTTSRVLSLRRVQTVSGFADAAFVLRHDDVPQRPSLARIAVDERGNGIAIWDQQTATGTYEVWAARIE